MMLTDDRPAVAPHAGNKGYKGPPPQPERLASGEPNPLSDFVFEVPAGTVEPINLHNADTLRPKQQDPVYRGFDRLNVPYKEVLAQAEYPWRQGSTMLDWEGNPGDPIEIPAANPKTLMGATKVPFLSVTPATALIEMARALEYGAFHAPRADGGKGYQPFNWREKQIEYMTYIDASMRHLLSAADREDTDPDTGDLFVWHLGEAMASIAILIDALHHSTVLDNRPANARGLVAQILRNYRKKV